MGKLHAEVQSKMLVMPLEKYSENGTTGIEKNYTSLMKIVSSAVELATMADDDVFYHNQTNNGTAAQLADATTIFGSTRTVTVNTSGGSGNSPTQVFHLS